MLPQFFSENGLHSKTSGLDLDILEPVVIVDDPLCFFDFVPDVAPGPTLPSLDAPGAGCI